MFLIRYLAFAFSFTFFILDSSYAETASRDEAIKRFFPVSYAGSIFGKKFENPIEVGVRNDQEVEDKKQESQEKKQDSSDANKLNNIEFQTSDISKKKFLPPDQTPVVAVNPEAPSSVISMIESSRRGDDVTAKAYAKQFVRTLQNYFFEVRKITGLIGEALIEETAIKDEDWVGAEQAIDIELAKTRLEKGIVIKPTQDVAMKRIVSDPKKEVEVFFFFARSCSYCRYMAPDLERLSRAFSEDKRVKITGLVVGENDENWLKEFRSYTGLSIPVFDGTEFAKHLKIGFLPVLLAVLPNGNRSYTKSGQQSLESMYEFVRVAQGLPVEDPIRLQALIKTPMGDMDKVLLTKNKKNTVIANHFGENKNLQSVNLPEKEKAKLEMDKF